MTGLANPFDVAQRLLSALGLGHAQNVTRIELVVDSQGCEVIVRSLVLTEDRTAAVASVLTRYALFAKAETPEREQ